MIQPDPLVEHNRRQVEDDLMAQHIHEMAEWLVEIGYPFDMGFPGTHFPRFLERPLVVAWMKHDNEPAEVCDHIYRSCINEGGWRA